jgi:tripartite-type tricarboxylate transporter receptor subunit TctC
MVVNRAMMKDLGFDPVKDFTPVVLIGNAPLVLSVSTNSPINSVGELVELAKSKPGRLSLVASVLEHQAIWPPLLHSRWASTRRWFTLPTKALAL